jgi:hypothetical protein
MSETDEAEAKRRAEWLHKHNAHKDWRILSLSEIAVIRGELLVLKRERDEEREKYLKEKEELDKTLDELVEASGRIVGISGQLLCSALHVGKLEKENAKLRDIAERAIKLIPPRNSARAITNLSRG